MPYGQLIVEISDRMPDLPYFDPHQVDGFPAESPVSIEDLQELYPTAAAHAREDEAFAQRARAAVVDLQSGRPGYRALWQHMRNESVAAIKKVRIVPEFSIENGFLTPTLKLKKGKIVRKFGGVIEGMYAGGTDVGREQN